MKHLGRSAALLVGVRAAGVGLQAAVVVYLARVLPIGDMGVYATVYAFAAIVRFVGPLGTDQTMMRRIGELGLKLGDPGSRRIQNLCNSAVVFVATAATAMAMIVTLSLWALGDQLGLVRGEVLAIALIVPANSVTGALVGQIRGFGYNVRAQLPEAIGSHLLFAIVFLSLTLLGSVDRAHAIYGLAAAAWGVLCIVLIARRRIGWPWSEVPAASSVRQIARESLPACWAMAHTVLAGRAPIFVTAWLLGSAATANLEIAMRFGIVATFVTGSVGVTFSPRFARLVQAGAHRELLSTLTSSSLLAGIPALAYLVVLAVAAPRVLGPVLPPDYAEAHLPMLVVATSTCLNAFLGPASNLLFMAGHAATVSAFSVARLVTVCMVAILLAGPLGVTGIAVAVVAGTVVRDGGLMVRAARLCRREPPSSPVQPVIASQRVHERSEDKPPQGRQRVTRIG